MNTHLIHAAFAISALQAAASAQLGWNLVANTGPTPRHQHAMAYDTQSGKVVMFGGWDGLYFGDTWEWDGASWSQVASTGPVARIRHALTYDSSRRRIVMYGGLDSSGVSLGDTWEWDGVSWTQVAAIGPSARFGMAITYDSQRNRIVLFGGNDGAYRADTWEWDGVRWIPRIFASGPSARLGHAMTYDSQRGRSVMFGGEGQGVTYLGDTWEWDGGTWQQRSTTGPGQRAFHAMTFEAPSGRALLFAGNDRNGVRLGDTWSWDGFSWFRLSTSGPSVRSHHGMAYDSQRDKTLVFGGWAGNFRGDTWEWDGSGAATTFGAGCGTPPLSLSPIVGSPPSINRIAQASLANIPSSVAFVAMGSNRSSYGPFSLPLTLDGLGMPGCDLLQSTDIAALPVAFSSPAAATFSLALPNDMVLFGYRAYLQAWAFAPVTNPGQTVVSNGLEWELGY